MLSAFIRLEDGRITTQTDLATLKAAVSNPNASLWLDMFKPTDQELSLLHDVFGFHPLAIEDTVQSIQRPKIENYCHTGDSAGQGYFYMVIHGPDLETFREHVRTKEIDIFLSQRYLVTVHDDPHKSINELLTRGKTDPKLILDSGIDVLLHNMIDKLVDNYLPIMDHLQEDIDTLEDDAVTDPKPKLLSQISDQRRELLHLRRVIGPQREVIAQLTRGEVQFIRENTRIYFRDVQDHLNRSVETIELFRDLITGIRDIYLSSISNNLNQIMKTLTVITVIALPLNVVTGFFGMNFEFIPGIHSRGAFWIAVSAMILAVCGMLLMFRRKRWL